MTSNLCPFKFSLLAERKSSKDVYHQIFKWKMNQAPKNVHRFCDTSLNENERKVLVRWLRNLEDKTSSQYLQIVFSFSIPSGESLEKIKNLEKPIISAGAGTGYWEYLLTHFYGVDVIAFDSNITYPENMHYMTIQKGGADILKNFRDRALFLAWPDKDDLQTSGKKIVVKANIRMCSHCLFPVVVTNREQAVIMLSPCYKVDDEESTFSLDCLHHYDGDIIIHVGELYGETFSNNPWGQSTSRIFQLELGKTFRCVYRRRLPSWPGYMDSLSIWWKIGVAVDCDGGMFCHVPGFETVGLK